MLREESVTHLEEFVAEGAHLLDTQISVVHENVRCRHTDLVEGLCVFDLVFVELLNVFKELTEAVVGTRVCVVAEVFITDKDLIVRVHIWNVVGKRVLDLRAQVPHD